MSKIQAVALLPSIAYATIGAAFFGAWGYWSNMDTSHVAATKAASIQASYSFALTFVSSEYLRWISKRFARWAQRAQFFATAALGWTTINGASALIHLSFGTPNIIQTIAPGLLIGLLFCLHASRRFSTPANAVPSQSNG